MTFQNNKETNTLMNTNLGINSYSDTPVIVIYTHRDIYMYVHKCVHSEFRNCVKVEVAVPGFPS